YNESPLGPVTPTLLITALGVMPDIRAAVTMDVKSPGNLVYIVGKTYRELGGSEYYRLMGFLGCSVPKVRVVNARKTFKALTRAIDLGIISSCHDLSEGGLAVAAAEMAFSGGYGLELDLRLVPRENLERNDLILFSESNSRFLLEVPEKCRADFEAIMRGCTYAEIGRVTRTQRLRIHGLNGGVVIDAPLTELRNCWKKTLG
ncbi:MAG: AIR synthase-related protein, partial [Candidatus Bathyarchaeota archaeon]|nr:AIR synthase-related protein [Candidatus Bathyarchaeota archaeon]